MYRSSTWREKRTPKVAVLIDRRTGSSGEAIAIAFRGRPETRFFGDHTEGASIANDVVKPRPGRQQRCSGHVPRGSSEYWTTRTRIAGHTPVAAPRYSSIEH
jgi:hypothetical protein